MSANVPPSPDVALEKKRARGDDSIALPESTATTTAEPTTKTEERDAPVELTLRFRFPGSSEVNTMVLDGNTEIGLLRFMLEDASQIPADCIKMLSGFPPKAVAAEDSQAIKDVFKKGDMVVVQKGEAQLKRGHTDGKYVPPSNDKGIFVRRAVPADNSCCFHSLAYVLENKSREKGPDLRARIAETVLANPQKFSAVYLGQPPAQYARWIMQKDSWGGAIELDIASFLYQTEIISLDIQSNRIDRFGVSEGYSTRAFVVYSGNHFDALAVAHPLSQAMERDDQVLFNPRDEKVMNNAIQFVRFECKK